MPDMLVPMLAMASIAAIAYWLKWMGQPQGMARTVMKTVPVLLLALASLATGQPAVLTAALVLSALGDAFLSRDGEAMFLAGLSAFLLAHLCYVGLFASDLRAGAFATVDGRAAILVMAGLAGLVLFRLWPHTAGMRGPVATYSLAISAMAVSAQLSGPGSLMLAGVAMFVVSDIILAFERFVPDFGGAMRPLMPSAVWLLYFFGQAAILAGHAGLA